MVKIESFAVVTFQQKEKKEQNKTNRPPKIQ